MTFIKWFIIFLILFGILAKIKAEVTCNNHCKIINAIRAYHINCVITQRKPVVSSKDMMDYEQSVKRIFDWGCKHILPKDKFELIKPFMED